LCGLFGPRAPDAFLVDMTQVIGAFISDRYVHIYELRDWSGGEY